MEESAKPPHLRRPVPQPPKNYDEVTVKGFASGNIEDALDAFNNEAFKNFNEQALVPCKHCNRTFLPDRLSKHMNIC